MQLRGPVYDCHLFSPLYGTFDELGEAFPGAAVVKRQAGLTFFLHAEAGRLDFGEGETEVLVQVIQLVDEISHVPAEHLRTKGPWSVFLLVKCSKYNLISGVLSVGLFVRDHFTKCIKFSKRNTSLQYHN